MFFKVKSLQASLSGSTSCLGAQPPPSQRRRGRCCQTPWGSPSVSLGTWGCGGCLGLPGPNAAGSFQRQNRALWVLVARRGFGPLVHPVESLASLRMQGHAAPWEKHTGMHPPHSPGSVTPASQPVGRGPRCCSGLSCSGSRMRCGCRGVRAASSAFAGAFYIWSWGASPQGAGGARAAPQVLARAAGVKRAAGRS